MYLLGTRVRMIQLDERNRRMYSVRPRSHFLIGRIGGDIKTGLLSKPSTIVSLRYLRILRMM